MDSATTLPSLLDPNRTQDAESTTKKGQARNAMERTRPKQLPTDHASTDEAPSEAWQHKITPSGLYAEVDADPRAAEVTYPEGPKVPEGDVHTTRRMELLHALRRRLSSRSDAWVYSDINIYYEEGNKNAVVAPDVAVVFGADRDVLAGQRVYRVWDTGVAPAFVMEIASDSTHRRDLDNKPGIYSELGVIEYWRLDTPGGKHFKTALAGEHRQDGRWAPIPILAGIDGTLTGHSTTLGLNLCWQPPKLRLHDPATDTWLLDSEQLDTALAAAETRAAAAEDRADREAAARAAAENRAQVEAVARAALEAELVALREQVANRSSD